ncbi:hypothetical protein I7I52_03064 [Histoplasma capsulatum]|uniref:Uncharacterized protein n=1 Tax=Ajellomyces capsulatus TaxID=5037 RepID=A0A8H7Z5T4_AJECA|nr:hypothetical protein I7I52_03064 [Histoplasma capsulatum]
MNTWYLWHLVQMADALSVRMLGLPLAGKKKKERYSGRIRVGGFFDASGLE